MKTENLHTLEYPRLMHHQDGTKRRVENAEEAEQAQKDGYALHPELTKKQQTDVDKALTPDQQKADAAVKKAAEDQKKAAQDAAAAEAHAAQVAAKAKK